MVLEVPKEAKARTTATTMARTVSKEEGTSLFSQPLVAPPYWHNLRGAAGKAEM